MQHRSTDTDETGVCQELLPSSDKRKDSSVGEERINMIPNIQSHHQNRNQHNKPHHSESGMFPSEKDSLSPQSTFTTETGNQLLYRLKTSGFNPKLSWTSNSAQLTPNDGGTTGTLNSTQKFSMKQIAIFPPRVKRRVVLKNGAINVNKEHVERRHQRYLQDTFTTMVDIKWRWNLLVFTLAFILSWLGFACVWWIICLAHGDLEPEHLSDESWTPCVVAINSFASAFLFSIETQHTIGYGSRSTTEECPEAIFVMCLQSITGVVIQCFVVGFVFAKLSRPQKRSQTLLFSSNAVINMRDGKLCFMFRIGDVRNRSHIIGAQVTAIMISKKSTPEGETIPFYQTEIPVKFDGSSDSIFLIWPATFVHVIDENSPFYEWSCDALIREKFEVVVILEGTVESTGQSIQARSSYLPSEILWGRRFENLVGYKKDSGEHRVDYSKFNNTFEVQTPSCSAKELAEVDRKFSQQSMYPTITDIYGNGYGNNGNVSNNKYQENNRLNSQSVHAVEQLPVVSSVADNQYSVRNFVNSEPNQTHARQLQQRLTTLAEEHHHQLSDHDLQDDSLAVTHPSSYKSSISS